jgi:hypothetical protein
MFASVVLAAIQSGSDGTTVIEAVLRNRALHVQRIAEILQGARA